MSSAAMEVETRQHDMPFPGNKPGDRFPLAEAEQWPNYEMMHGAGFVRLVSARPAEGVSAAESGDSDAGASAPAPSASSDTDAAHARSRGGRPKKGGDA